MGMILKGTKREFELPPSGSHQARCWLVCDLGTQDIAFKAELRSLRKVILGFELPLETRQDGQAHTVFKTFTASLSEKANLRKFLESWRGKPFAEAELEGWDIGKVLTASCFLNVTHRESKSGNAYADVSAVMPLPKGTSVMEPINRPLELDLGAYDPAVFELLPGWVQEKIRVSPEFKQLQQDGIPASHLPDDMVF